MQITCIPITHVLASLFYNVRGALVVAEINCIAYNTISLSSFI